MAYYDSLLMRVSFLLVALSCHPVHTCFPRLFSHIPQDCMENESYHLHSAKVDAFKSMVKGNNMDPCTINYLIEAGKDYIRTMENDKCKQTKQLIVDMNNIVHQLEGQNDVECDLSGYKYTVVHGEHTHQVLKRQIDNTLSSSIPQEAYIFTAQRFGNKVLL